MNEMILLLLTVVGVFSVVCSVMLITLGKMVDRFSPGDEEATRPRGITGPVESTQIAVVLFWVLFLPGAWAVLQEGTVTIILGTTLLFAICLFLLTALVFTFAVLSAMSRRKNENSDAVEVVSTSNPAGSSASSGEPAGNPTPGKNPLSDGAVSTLLKK
jgi:hypothetical protein